MIIDYLPLFILLFILAIKGFFYLIDRNKNRVLKNQPFITFIVPCFNDGNSVGRTIKSICKSYNNFELFVIDDKSSDNSLEVISKLQKKYKFKFIKNKKNLGKAESVNRIFDITRGDILWIVDSDVEIKKENVIDVLKRFDYDLNLGAVSCPYKVRGNGVFERLQEIDYNIQSAFQISHNVASTLSLWGGCLAVKRDIFKKAGMFSKNMILEDMGLALKINKLGYSVEQGMESILTSGHTKIKGWYRQRLRWISGGIQCVMTYPSLYFTHPIYLLFLVSYSLLAGLFIYSLTKAFIFYAAVVPLFENLRSSGMGFLPILWYTWDVFGATITDRVEITFGFLVFLVPFAVMSMKSLKESYKILYVVPFSFIYSPMLFYAGVVGFFKGIKSYYQLRDKNQRAW